MKARKLLMLINFFPPAGGGGVYRPLSFVKHLARSGWEITVVTPKPGEFWICDPSLERQVPDNVRIVRTGSLSAGRVLGMLRGRGEGKRAGARPSGAFELMRKTGEAMLLPDTYTGWRPFAVRAALRLCAREPFDALYSTSPPDSTQLAGLKVAEKTGLPWLADFRDPWISLHLREPVSPLHRRMLEGMERRVASRADTVAVTTKWHLDDLMRRVPGCNAVRIPNGYDEDDFSSTAPVLPQGPMRITHCGMLTMGRRSRVFLEGLSRFILNEPGAGNDLRVTFIGARESGNEDMSGLPGIAGIVEFEDNLPHAECVARERSSHALLLIKHDDKRYDGLVPGKLYEYIGARRPILALAPSGEAAETVAGLRRGEVAGPGDAGAVAEAIGRLYSAYRDGSLDDAYDLSPRPEFSRRAAAESLGRELDMLVERRDGR